MIIHIGGTILTLLGATLVPATLIDKLYQKNCREILPAGAEAVKSGFAGMSILLAMALGLRAFSNQINPQWFVFGAVVSLLLLISWIDARTLRIPSRYTWVGTGIGITSSLLLCGMTDPGTNPRLERLEGLVDSTLGWIAGFGGLWLIAVLGKMAMGKTKREFEIDTPWRLEDSADENSSVILHLGEERIEWWDIFSRKTDQLKFHSTATLLNGTPIEDGVLTLREESLETPDGKSHPLAEVASLEGKTLGVTIPREVMGMGDVHLLGMIGACFGPTAVFFSLAAACVSTLGIAAIQRIGFGKQLPFGPALAGGALVWFCGAHHLWDRLREGFIVPVW